LYIPDVAGKEPGTGLPFLDAKYPLLDSYVDVVVEGGLEFGEDYARELIGTTRDWSTDWLNDRPLARRPWVADKNYQMVDTMLREYVPVFTQRSICRQQDSNGAAAATLP
jgi:hypothetical protein